MGVADTTLLIYWLSVIGLLGCLGMALNLLIAMYAALFCRGKITLDFNKHQEHVIEIVLCSGLFICGTYGVIYLIIH